MGFRAIFLIFAALRIGFATDIPNLSGTWALSICSMEFDSGTALVRTSVKTEFLEALKLGPVPGKLLPKDDGYEFFVPLFVVLNGVRLTELGASASWLLISGRGRPDPNPENSFFVLRRIEKTADCAEIAGLFEQVLKK